MCPLKSSLQPPMVYIWHGGRIIQNVGGRPDRSLSVDTDPRKMPWQADLPGLGSQTELLQDKGFLWTMVHRYADLLSALRAEDRLGNAEVQEHINSKKSKMIPRNSSPLQSTPSSQFPAVTSEWATRWNKNVNWEAEGNKQMWSFLVVCSTSQSDQMGLLRDLIKDYLAVVS